MTALLGAIMGLTGLLGVAATLFSLPGVWLIVGTAALIDVFRPETFSLTTLVVAVAIGLVAEVIELVAAGAGASKAGGAKRSALGGIVGGIVGAVVGTPIMPVVGTILGASLGAGVGAAILERTRSDRTWGDALRVGHGAAVGRLVATLFKAMFAAGLAVYLTVAAVV